MIAIRKLGWSVLVLAAFVGCANKEESTTTPPPSEAPTTPANPAPETPPPATTPGEAKPEAGGTGAATTTPTTPDMPKVEGPSIEAPAPAPAPKEEAGKPEEATKPEEEKKSEEQADAASLSSEEVAAIKELPADEAALALKQMVCPVSEENLGSMGKPVKVTAEGRTFFLCCKGCNKEVAADPAAVVAKLKK